MSVLLNELDDLDDEGLELNQEEFNAIAGKAHRSTLELFGEVSDDDEGEQATAVISGILAGLVGYAASFANPDDYYQGLVHLLLGTIREHRGGELPGDSGSLGCSSSPGLAGFDPADLSPQRVLH
jgi:hypothetical protein